MGTVSDLLTFNVLSVTTDLTQYKIMLADSSTGSGLYLRYGRVFLSGRLYFMAVCWRIIFASKSTHILSHLTSILTLIA